MHNNDHIYFEVNFQSVMWFATDCFYLSKQQIPMYNAAIIKKMTKFTMCKIYFSQTCWLLVNISSLWVFFKLETFFSDE